MKIIFLIFILVVALYFGTGGFIILDNEQRYEKALTLEKKEVTSEGVQYYNKEVMITANQQELIIIIYPWSILIPSALSFILTAISFGIIGSIGKVVNDSIQKKIRLTDTLNLFFIPLQGGIIGLIILGVSYIIPVVLTNDDVLLKPITIVFLSLFGGIFYLDFYKWLGEVFTKMVFKKQ